MDEPAVSESTGSDASDSCSRRSTKPRTLVHVLCQGDDLFFKVIDVAFGDWVGYRRGLHVKLYPVTVTIYSILLINN